MHSRHILERVPQLSAQVLDVQPLALLYRLPREVHVVHCQLGLVKQPLHHEHRAWGDGSAGPCLGAPPPTPAQSGPRLQAALQQAPGASRVLPQGGGGVPLPAAPCPLPTSACLPDSLLGPKCVRMLPRVWGAEGWPSHPPGGGSTGWEQGGQPSWFAWNPVDFPHRACEGPSRTQMTRSPFGGGEWDSGPGLASEGWTLGWDPGGTEVWTRPGPAAAGGALTAQGWEDFVAKEAVPLLALLELAPTALWDHPVPVPGPHAAG